MSKQVHWLCPANEHALSCRHGRRNLIYQPVDVNSDDILFPGSDDDESDIDQRCTKKRRIERLANHYLSGKTLFISTARLRGPFGKPSQTFDDRYSHYVVGSPLLPDPVSLSNSEPHEGPFIDESCEKQTLDTVHLEPSNINVNLPALPSPARPSSLFKKLNRRPRQTPEPDPADHFEDPPSALTATPSRTPHRAPTSIVAPCSNPALPLDDARDDAEATGAAHYVDKATSPPASTGRTQEESTSHSSTDKQHIADESLKPVFTPAEPRFPVSTGFTPINQPALASPVTSITEIRGKSTGKLPKVTALLEKRRRRYVKIASHGDDSPLMIRRKIDTRAEDNSSVAGEQKAKRAPVTYTSKARPRKILFDSSVNIPSQRNTESQPSRGKLDSSDQQSSSQPPKSSAKGQTEKAAPAIDISFDQGSLAMNFDLVGQHTNSLPPASHEENEEDSMSEQLKLAMRHCGASSGTNSLIPEASYSSQGDDVADQVEGICVTEPVPYISTQAAMEEAHLALFDTSSPAKANVDSTLVLETRPTSIQRISKPPVSITPFRDFNAKMAADFTPGTSAPPANTQALFDNMSPFISPEVSTRTKRGKRASFAPSALSKQSKSSAASPSFEVGIQVVSSMVMPEGHEGAGDTENFQFTPQTIGTGTKLDRHGPQSGTPIVPRGMQQHPMGSRSSDRADEVRNSTADRKTTHPAEQISSPAGKSIPTAQKRTNKRTRRTPRSSRRQSAVNHIGRPNTSSALNTRSARSSMATSELMEPSTLTPELSSIDASYGASVPSDAPHAYVTTREPGTVTDTSQAAVLNEAPPSIADEQHFVTYTPLDMTDIDMTIPPTSARSMNPVATSTSSFQYAQKAGDDLDLDSTIESITRTVLSSWDVEKAIRTPVDASA